MKKAIKSPFAVIPVGFVFGIAAGPAVYLYDLYTRTQSIIHILGAAAFGIIALGTIFRIMTTPQLGFNRLLLLGAAFVFFIAMLFVLEAVAQFFGAMK